jgi:NitT/TauT family transport system substrate-binding protein
MKQLRIGYLSTMHHSSHILKGLQLLEIELGIEPLWHLFGTGPAMIEAFAAGELDVGYIGLPPLMIGIGRGLPLVCVAGGHCEGTVMVGSADMRPLGECESTEVALQQFKGQKIGTPSQGSIHDIIIRNLLEECGLNSDCVVNYPWADLIAEDVRQGNLAGAVGTPPLAVMCQKWYGMKTVLSPETLWPFNPSYGIAVNKQMLKEANLLRDFLILHENACNMTRLDPERAAKVIADTLKVVDVKFIKDVFAVSPRYCASLPKDYIEATMKFVPVLQKMGHLKEALSADQVFDCSFIKKTHPEPPHYYPSA